MKRKITLTLDADQLNILLGHLEGMFSISHSNRTEEALAAEIEDAAESWKPGDDGSSFDFEVVRIAPVYRQLLAYWNRWGKQENNGTLTTDSIVEFVAHLRTARNGSGPSLVKSRIAS